MYFEVYTCVKVKVFGVLDKGITTQLSLPLFLSMPFIVNPCFTRICRTGENEGVGGAIPSNFRYFKNKTFSFNRPCLTTPQQIFRPSTFSVLSYDRSFECAKKCKEIAQTMHRKISLQLCRYSQCSAYKYLKIECKKCAGKGLNSFISNEINKDNLKLHN